MILLLGDALLQGHSVSYTVRHIKCLTNKYSIRDLDYLSPLKALNNLKSTIIGCCVLCSNLGLVQTLKNVPLEDAAITEVTFAQQG